MKFRFVGAMLVDAELASASDLDLKQMVSSDLKSIKSFAQPDYRKINGKW